VPANITENDLKAIWEAGVDGIITEAGYTRPGELKELRSLIGKLPPRSSSKQGKSEALLPRIGSAGETEPEPEEDDEEYD
jgi:hypothetical protein